MNPTDAASLKPMPHFAANLSMLFADSPLLERFARAAKAGFSAVEVQFPYEATATQIRAQLDEHALRMVLHNLPPGNFAAGERGIACHPKREDEFRAGVALAMAYATVLGVPQLNCLCGIAPPGADEVEMRCTVINNLRYAAAALGKAGLKLLVEPINNYDVPGFWLNSTKKAISVMDEVGSDNLYLQYDAYHAQRFEGELATTIERLLPRIAHIQIADNPGRHEPGTGEINYPFLFAHLHRIGYRGFIAAEYLPAGTTEEGLGWLSKAREQALHFVA